MNTNIDLMKQEIYEKYYLYELDSKIRDYFEDEIEYNIDKDIEEVFNDIVAGIVFIPQRDLPDWLIKSTNYKYAETVMDNQLINIENYSLEKHLLEAYKIYLLNEFRENKTKLIINKLLDYAEKENEIDYLYYIEYFIDKNHSLSDHIKNMRMY